MGSAEAHTGDWRRDDSSTSGRQNVLFGDLLIDNLGGHAEQATLSKFSYRADDACWRRAVHAASPAKPTSAPATLQLRNPLTTAELLALMWHVMLQELGLRRCRAAAVCLATVSVQEHARLVARTAHIL